MLNFIICDDETAITNTVKDIIVKTIFKTSIEYKIHVFHNYDDSFYEIIHSDLINKIYILDIEVNDKSGLEIAKEIRKRDWDSVIFILSAHYELEHLAFKSKVLIFDFISKFDLYDKRMKECILACINKVLNDEKLTVRVNRATTKIDYKEDDISAEFVFDNPLVPLFTSLFIV